MPAREPPSSADAIEQKLSAARAQLVIEKPFLGSLVLRLPLIEADPAWCPHVATDMQALYYNRAYIDKLSLDQTKFVLAHEALHCALSHFHRRQHRRRQRWDIACDYAVNGLLVADGLIPPPDALMHARYVGMPAEEIYPCIQENTDEQTLDEHLYSGETHEDHGGGPLPLANEADAGDKSLPTGATTGAAPTTHAAAGRPRLLTPEQRGETATQWQLRLTAAAQAALQAGKLGDVMQRVLQNFLTPRLPWRAMLARYVNAVARTDYSFGRPNRREGTAILPGLRAGQIDVVIVIDTSGSINAAEMDEFLSEVNALKGTLNARVTLHACDAALDAGGPWVYEPWEEVRLPKTFSGGGGTRFTPAFEWAERLDRQPDVMLYFTDAEGESPPREPSFPVLWLVKGNAPVPWGQRVQLN